MSLESPNDITFGQKDKITKGWRELDDFLARNKIELKNEKTLGFCKSGYREMAGSKEPVHQTDHLDRMISILDEFIRDYPEELGKIDFDSLLISIYHHDIWKIRDFAKSNHPIRPLIADLVEGLEASKLTGKMMKEFGFEDVNLISNVCDSIEKHADVHFGKRKTHEAQLLSDLDFLDNWLPDRIKMGLKNINFNSNSLHHRLIFDLYFQLQGKHMYNHPFFQNIANKRVEEFKNSREEIFKEFR